MVNKKQATAKPEEVEGEEGGILIEYAPVPPKSDDPGNTNLDTWRELFDVPSTNLKEFKRSGGFKGHDINPTWRMQKMTEVFGSIGYGWGYEIVERWRESFSIRKYKDAEREDVENVFVKIRVWYVPNGETPAWAKDPETGAYDRRKPPINAVWTGEQIGGTEIERGADEAWKMAITDAVGKCMVQIGLAAAIYLGQWDDSKYRGDQLRAEAIRKGETLLVQLQEALPQMESLHEMIQYTDLPSFKAKVDDVREHDWKLFKKIEAVLFEYNTRLAESYREELGAFLAGVKTSEDFEAGIGPFYHAAKFILSDDIKKKLRADVAAFKKRVSETQEENQEKQQSLPKDNAKLPPSEEAVKDQAKEPAKPTLGRFELTYDKGGNPRWGALAKALKEAIEIAVASDPRPPLPEIQAFYQAHAKLLDDMKSAEGAPKEWAETLIANYNALVAMVED